MNYDYDELVRNYSKNFIQVTLDPNYVRKIQEFVNSLIQQKVLEKHHWFDHNKEFKRFMTGLMGEAAVEKLLGIDIIDWTIGKSKDYNTPDIHEYGLGIKTVEIGKFPIIFKNNNYPQIICVRNPKYSNLVYVCGLASVDVLNKYQTEDLILDKGLRRRGIKTGFYGFKYLKRIESLKDICEYKKE